MACHASTVEAVDIGMESEQRGEISRAENLQLCTRGALDSTSDKNEDFGKDEPPYHKRELLQLRNLGNGLEQLEGSLGDICLQRKDAEHDLVH